MIDDYNQFMGGVDIADQLRSNYPTHQRSLRTWLPLWFWALDTTITNAYVISTHFISPSTTTGTSAHKNFRLQLARSLIKIGSAMAYPSLQNPIPHYRTYGTLPTTLPPFSIRTRGDHQEDHRPDLRRRCWYCRYKKVHGDPKKPPPSPTASYPLGPYAYQPNRHLVCSL